MHPGGGLLSKMAEVEKQVWICRNRSFRRVEWIQNILGGRKYSDGMNEAGLSAGILWLDATKFSAVIEAEMGCPHVDLISYTLGSFVRWQT